MLLKNKKKKPGQHPPQAKVDGLCCGLVWFHIINFITRTLEGLGFVGFKPADIRGSWS